jgi:hypothetical protein
VEETSKAVGCLGTILVLALLGWIITSVEKCSAPAEREGFPGPIPVRFQGAYNSYMCGRGAEGLVTVGGDDINYGGAKFEVTDLVSESQNSITLRGEPVAANGRESSRTFTITYAPVGETARLDGVEFERCSQY